MAGLVFRHAVGPALGRPVGAAGIDHPYVGVGDQRHRLARGVIRQAQDHQIGGVQHLAPALGILPFGFRQADQRHVAAVDKPCTDLKAGGSDVAVDENCGRHVSWSPFPCRSRTIAEQRCKNQAQSPHKERARAGSAGPCQKRSGIGR